MRICKHLHAYLTDSEGGRGGVINKHVYVELHIWILRAVQTFTKVDI